MMEENVSAIVIRNVASKTYGGVWRGTFNE